MQPKEYLERVLLHKSNVEYIDTVDTDLIHGIVGIASEAGEIADLLKKMFFHPNKLISRDMIIDECGDLLWYIALTLRSVDSGLEDALARNVAKLELRYNKNGGEKDRAAEAQAQAEAGN